MSDNVNVNPKLPAGLQSDVLPGFPGSIAAVLHQRDIQDRPIQPAVVGCGN